MNTATSMVTTTVTAPDPFTARKLAAARIDATPALRECVLRVDGEGTPLVLSYAPARAISGGSPAVGGIRGEAFLAAAPDEGDGATSYIVGVVVDPTTAAKVTRLSDAQDWRTARPPATHAGAARLGTRGSSEAWRVDLLLGGTGHDVAVSDGDRVMTYDELRAAAERVAMRVLAARDRARVLLRGRRDVRTAAAMLGCWMAGAAWCAVDLAAPVSRRKAVEADVRPDLVLDAAEMDLDSCGAPDGGRELPGGLGADDVAYFVASSGSTGRPKVSALPAGGLAPLVRAWRQEYGFSDPQVVCQIGSLEGDVFLGDLLKALGTGGALHIVPDERRADPAAVADLVAGHACSFVESTPVMIAALLRELDRRDTHWPGLVVVGSDVFRAAEARALTGLAGARTRIVNGYGTTECMIESLVYDCDEMPVDHDGLCPVGRPLPGTEVTIRRPDGSVAAVGEVGTLCLAAPGAMVGYVVDGELRASGPEVDTGDRAAMDTLGVVTLYGRADSMVKVRGHRVEPAEVEDALLRIPGVREAHVTSFRRAGASELMAFVAGSGVGDVVGDVVGLRATLRRTLTDAAVPAVFKALPRLPRLETGKLDRLAMDRQARAHERPLEHSGGRAAADHVEATGDMDALEHKVAGCWQSVLGASPDRAAGFFDQGGTSVLLIALAEHLRETLGPEHPVAVADLFRHPSIDSYVGMLRGRRAVAPTGAQQPGAAASTARRRVLEDVAAGRLSVEEARRLMTS